MESSILNFHLFELENPENDINLFNRVKRGDRMALNTLFTHYYQRLCTFSNSFVSNREEAEEIVSDVFFNLWKNRNHISIQTNFRSYVYICVRNASLAVGKKRLPLFEDIDDSEASKQLVSAADPEASLHFEELKQYIDEIIAHLPAGCRQIFIMSRYDGLRYKEISEILSISEKTVENQLIKALAFLRKNINSYYRWHPKLFPA